MYKIYNFIKKFRNKSAMNLHNPHLFLPPFTLTPPPPSPPILLTAHNPRTICFQ